MHDLRFALRTLRNSPGFSALAILALSLGIGANTAIFSGLYGLVLRPLPYRNASQLVMLWDSNRATGLEHAPVMEGSYPILRREAKSFDGMAAFVSPASHDDMFVSRVWGTEERVSTCAVTSPFFQVLGVAPILGRTFLPEEDLATVSGERLQSAHVAILSWTYWREHYGASPDVIGKALSLNDFGEREQYTIVGVMPEVIEFPFPLYPAKPDMWVNLTRPERFSPGNNLNVVGRLKASVSVAQAEAEVHTIADRIRAQYPKFYKDEYVSIVPLSSELIRNVRSVLWVLLAAFSFILLIGWADVGCLLLVRAMSREREMAIRATLGAGRMPLIRQMLTEALLLAVAGGTLGVLLAYAALRIFLEVLPTSIYIPRLDSVVLDLRVVVFAAGLSVIAASLCSVLPSLRLALPNLNEALKSGSLRREQPQHSALRRPGSALLILELSLALVLLTGTLLMLRSMEKLLAVNGQFQPEHLLSMNVQISNAYFLQHNDDSFLLTLYAQFEQRVAALPGVRSIALADRFPPGHGPGQDQFKADGGGGRIAEAYQPAAMRVVTSAYFAMMDMNLVRGRWFEDADRLKSLPVAVINDVMAQRYWRDSDPVGQKIEPFFRYTDAKIAYTIVGVLHEPKRFGSGATPEPTVYLDYSQVPLSGFSAIVRTAGVPKGIGAALRSAGLQIVPGEMFVGNVETGNEMVSEASAMPRFTTQLLTTFSSLALLLAVVGVYGLISYYTSQRTHEIGVRMSLGAQRGNVLRLILSEGMLLTGAGIGIGLLASYGFAKSLASLVYGISVTDFYSFTTAAVLFFVVAMAACWIPARRAMLADPMVSLRHE